MLEMFHPVIRTWFEREIGDPSPPQRDGWPVIARGENVLISAPTGSGKTLAAFLEGINYLLQQGLKGDLPQGVQVLYISPLKALNNDIFRNLEVPLAGIEQVCSEYGLQIPAITRAVRTGDTPANERQKMLRKPPHILITTPESLYLLLTSRRARGTLRNVRYLIVDEIHAMLDSKRGTHLALSIERLQQLVGRPFTRIGLSATVEPLERAARYLGGWQVTNEGWQARPVRIVAPKMEKRVDLKVQVPVEDYRALPDGTIWTSIYQDIWQLVQEHRSTLVFVNNRAVAEKVSHNLNRLAGRKVAKAHHGCISRESRLEVERQLKSGQLPCLVATSSLELGIDIGAIDLMVQIASPKSVARGLQRLGRSGHRLDAVSRGRIIPRTRADLLESVIISQEMLQGDVEQIQTPTNSLDVLAQQLVAMASVEEWKIEQLMQLIQSADPYHAVSEDEVRRTLCMLAGSYEHQEDAPRSPRLIWDEINGLVRGNNYSRLLAIGNAGTIPDRGYYGVYLEDRTTRVGELDETFVFEARRGDRFMLGTSAWRIVRIEKDRVIVAASTSGGAQTPFWTGEGLGRPYELGLRFGRRLREFSEKLDTGGFVEWLRDRAPVDKTAARNLQSYLQAQHQAVGAIQSDRHLVVEHCSDEAGDRRVIVHSPFGGRVNAGLAILLEQIVADQMHCQVQTVHSDDGVLLHLYGANSYPVGLFDQISADQAEPLLLSALPSTSLYAIAFRHNAARALMMGVKQHGKRTPLWIQRARALETLQIAAKHANHPLVVETMRECLQTVLDVPGLLKVLAEIESGSIEVTEKVTDEPSPFAAELLFKFLGLAMYEGLIPNPKPTKGSRMSAREGLNLTYKLPSRKGVWDKSTVQSVKQQNNPTSRLLEARGADDLHALLKMFGDLQAYGPEWEELSTSNPQLDGLLNELSHAGRAVLLNFDQNPLWVAAEEAELYRSALNGDDIALGRIVRRFARYYSPFALPELNRRYPLGHERLRRQLDGQVLDGMLVAGQFASQDDEWCHTTVLERIRRRSLQAARAEVKTQRSASYASFLYQWQGIGRKNRLSCLEGVHEVLRQLQGLYLPISWWEEFVLPSRVQGYRAEYLDQLSSTGRVAWRVAGGSQSPKLAWFIPGDFTEDVSPCAAPTFAGEAESRVYMTLLGRGASFLHELGTGTGLSTAELLLALENLLWQGLVVNDSFTALRYFLSRSPQATRARAKHRALAYRPDMGRFSVPRGLIANGLEQQLDQWFKRYGLVCKEVVDAENSPFAWSDIYSELERWEYIGQVDRGYYVDGLSGRQFMLSSAAKELARPASGQWQVLVACDPAQIYGKLVSHNREGLNWTCAPGNAVVFWSGEPMLLAERNGERVTPAPGSTAEQQTEAVAALVQAWQERRVWSNLRKFICKQWGGEPAAHSNITPLLSKLGFLREVDDMVLWRNL